MTSKRAWTAILLAVLVVDVAARLLVGFDFNSVMVVEGPLFGLTAAVLFWQIRRDGDASAWPRAIRVLIIACFALGALRALLYASGLELFLANLCTLAVAVLAAAFSWHRRRRSRRPATP